MKNRIAEIIDSYIDKKEIYGASVLIYKDGEVFLSSERGLADRRNKIPFSQDTILRMYSMSKPITSAAVMILIERGILDRGEPVSEYISSFKDQYYYDKNGGKKPVSREVTIGDLLDMSSGLSYPDETTPAGKEAAELFKDIDRRLGAKNEMSTVEIAEAIGNLTLAFDPGSDYLYGTSADVLGAVIEKASGISFSEFLRKEIFEPLNMEDTGFFVPADKQDRLARSYVSDRHIKNGLTENELPMSEDGTNEYLGNFLGIKNRMETAPAFESGGAGIASTLSDYMRFGQMLLNGGTTTGGVRILSPATVDHMTKRMRPSFINDSFHKDSGLFGSTYSNLLRICYAPEEGNTIMFKGEYGWDGWLGPHFANIPSKNATLLIGVQMASFESYSLIHKIVNVAASEL